MLSELKIAFVALKDSKEFRNWKLNHGGSFLCSAFLTDEKWQIDYYNSNDTITSFVNNRILEEESKVFKKDEDKVKELNLDSVDIDLDKTFEIIDKLMIEKYKNEMVNKKIIIIQNINDTPVWNITYLTSSSNILNIKINAESGQIISESLTNALSFNAK